MKKFKSAYAFYAAAAAVFIILMLCNPDICTAGAAEGLLLCGRVIIPSLYPFTVCVLFILKSGVLNHLGFIAPFTEKVFRITPKAFLLMVLSFTGGYPIGAKLLNQAAETKQISRKNAEIMLNYCVNAGPGFIILAVGSRIIGSKTIGYILLTAHILASFLLAFICSFFMTPEAHDYVIHKSQKNSGITDDFVSSAAEAASAVFGICGYVILFSAITAYINYFSETFIFIKYSAYVLEVTNAVSLTNNIYLISFLLGFSGISVWFQVFSLCRSLNVNIAAFIGARLFHGISSTASTYALLKIFNVTIPVFSNGKKIFFTLSYGTAALSVSMFCMLILFIISLYTKKHTGKFPDNLL